MKLDTFITSVLQDIESGLRNAGRATGKSYWITSPNRNPGVSFDIAVTAKDETSTQAGGTAEGKIKGGLKLGFVEVVTANVGANVDSRVEQTSENSEVSRIQFTVSIPTKTDEESEQESRAVITGERSVFGNPY